jgi:nicotinate phosphoribosyltransferase
MAMINSLLDTDLYKFTMMQVVWGRFSDAQAEYAFACRDASVDLTPILSLVRAEIDALGRLRFTEDELAYLSSIRYLKPEFVQFLRGFALDPVQVLIGEDASIRIKGPWLATILFEVFVLAIVNEAWMQFQYPMTEALRAEGERRLSEKCEQIACSQVTLNIMEFGTRRRYSREWQESIVKQLAPQLIGTSNVALARTLGLKPFGTMAHEFLQAGQAYAPLLQSQKFMLEAWTQFYRGDLGIALSDVFGFDAFLADFDRLFAKSYDGCRHDSGDAAAWGEKLLGHYATLGIDAKTKTAVFSDGLTIPKATALATQFDGRIRTLFGIGTDLTNDLGVKALPIVLKLVRLNQQPVVKLSDSPGKSMADDANYLAYVRGMF